MKVSEINSAVIIPTYNNDKTLRKVIDGVLLYCDERDLIVVNDGSTDRTAFILESYEHINVISYTNNQGKGHALKLGFKEAIAKGYERAITIDSDGQHFVEDIPKFIETIKEKPDALIMGSRNMEQEDVPGKSSFGNKFSNFWFKFETGITLPDTQTGFRLYPLAPLKKMSLFTTKFETEIEVLVKMAWRDVEIIPIPIKVIYDMEDRVSHFRPFKDFSRISVLNTYLVTLTLLYFLPKRIVVNTLKKGLWNIIKAELFKAEESNFKKSISVGFGFFMGIVPLWGFQLLIGIPLSIFFRMNKALFIAAANISLPPMIPFIIYGSYLMGSGFVANDVEFSSLSEITLESIHINFVQYAIGAVILAVLAGIVGFITSYLLLTVFRKK